MSMEFVIIASSLIGLALGKIAFMAWEVWTQDKSMREMFKSHDEDMRLSNKYGHSGRPEGCRYGIAPDCYGIGDYRIRDFETGKDVRVRAMHSDALRDAEALNNGTQDFELEEVKSLAEICNLSR